jgi:coenzyme F420-reducing hydrogenase alpha subunit
LNRELVLDTGPLARVEGEGSLLIEREGNTVRSVQLKIYEPPRFFEGFLKGRKAEEVIDIVPRICGICPVAYQVSALNALESLFEAEVDEEVLRLRRILYLGEWIESHSLHIYMLAAPDYLRVPDVAAIAGIEPNMVRDALALKRLGNGLMAAIGGREIHPVSLRIGGVHKAPRKELLSNMLPEIDRLRETIKRMVRFVFSLEKPSLQRDRVLASLTSPDRYAIDGGEIITSRGSRFPPSAFEENFVESEVRYSNALQSHLKDGTPYEVGPQARFNLNFEQLNPVAKEMAKEMGLVPPVTDPFQNIGIRAIETIHALEEVRTEIEVYMRPPHPYVSYQYRAGTCFGVSEAPRGMLYHSYVVNAGGQVERAKIVPPTAQNLARIEADVRLLAPRIMNAERNEATRISEMAVRNYDPCISCATHFLKLKVRDVRKRSRRRN